MNLAPQGQVDAKVADELMKLKKKFEDAMNDDLNTSIGLSVMFDLVRLSGKLLEDSGTTKETLLAADDMFRKLGGDVLGIVKDQYEQTSGSDEKIIDSLVKWFIEQRADARNRKDFAMADAIRNKLIDMGIILEDKPGQTVWRMK